ncbi:hypothetical protein ACIRBY_16310 [Streptomyces sp. NPDC096136]|uniref:hypothetical protein n=1 Tax=Streptomyces sp. NPDC096136 TaxID=3366076 RepID=UPI003800725A
MTDEVIYADSCPLCLRPLRPEFGRSRESGLDGPARVWFKGYRCDGCEATQPEQFWAAIRDRYKT